MLIRDIFEGFLNGKRKLWQAWWLIWVLPTVVFNFLANDSLLDNASQLVVYLVIGIFCFFYVFGAVASWQCVDNSNSRFWSGLAAGLIVLSPIFSLGKLSMHYEGMHFNFLVNFSLIGVLVMIITLILGRKDKKNFFSKKYLMASVIAVTYLSLFVGTLIVEVDEQGQEAIIAYVALYNKNLPIRLDKITVLRKVYVANKVVNYQYAVDADKSALNLAVFYKMKEAISPKACANRLLRWFLTHGYSLSYNYNDIQGKAIVKILIKETDCKKPIQPSIEDLLGPPPTVNIKAPNGNVYAVPLDQVEAALKAGGERV